MLERKLTKHPSWNASKWPLRNAGRNSRIGVSWTMSENKTVNANSKLKLAVNGTLRNGRKTIARAEVAANFDVVCMVASLDTRGEILMLRPRRTVQVIY